MKISENNGTMTIVMCNGKIETLVSDNMKTRKEKTRKHEVIEGGEITCNCNVSIGLLAIDWVEGYEPEMGDVWYGFTPFGCYAVYENKGWWVAESMDGVETIVESKKEGIRAINMDFKSWVFELLGRPFVPYDRIKGSWRSCDEDGSEEFEIGEEY